MKTRVYLSMVRTNVDSIAHSFEVGSDNVISISHGAIQEDNEVVPAMFRNKGYYYCAVKSISEHNEYSLTILK